MKVFAICLTLILLIYKSRVCRASFSVANQDAYSYLIKYGYVSSMSELVSGATSPEAALRNFQSYAKIRVTGKMDAATKAKLRAPRCGSKDREPSNVAQGMPVNLDEMRRRKRYVQQGTMWQKTALTYSLHDKRQPSKSITSDDVVKTMDKAFKMWQAVTALTFRRIGDNNAKADIVIKFGAGPHGDPLPFDGNGGTLAHGFFPLDNKGFSGDIHFDDDEEWTLNGKRGTPDFLWTALHEIGHAIGLGHSDTRDAIMWPWYEGYQQKFQLKKDDIAGIQSIYGPRPRPVVPVITGTKRRRSTTICNQNSFDAVVYSKILRDTYFFKGDKVWTMDKSKYAGNDERIASKWPGLPGNIDSAYIRPDSSTVFFKGNKFWRYDYRFKKIEGPRDLSVYIKNIREFRRDPKKRLGRINAAMIWDGNGRTYFFGSKYYWRFNEKYRTLDRGYPRRIENWRKIKKPVYGAMSWRKSKTFFLHGDEIYRFENSRFEVKIKKNTRRNKISYFIKNCRSRFRG